MKNLLQIVLVSASIVISFGLSLMIKSHLSEFISSKALLYILLILFTLIGASVVYKGLKPIFTKEGSVE